jgi:hypothetical protein
MRPSPPALVSGLPSDPEGAADPRPGDVPAARAHAVHRRLNGIIELGAQGDQCREIRVVAFLTDAPAVGDDDPLRECGLLVQAHPTALA